MYIYILSSGELFNPYHLSPEPEKSIDMGMNILPVILLMVQKSGDHDLRCMKPVADSRQLTISTG